MMGLDASDWQAVRLSLWVACWATAFVVPLALLTAYALTRWHFPGRGVLNALTFLPLILPPVVTGYVLLILFSPAAPIGGLLESLGLGVAFRWQGAALAAAIMAFPLSVRAMRLGLEAVDPALEEAAATLGSSPIAVFWTITLPLIWPSVLAGGVLGFAKSLGEFGATITFVSNIPGQTETLPSAIYTALQVPGGERIATGLSLVAVVLALGALVLSEALARRAQRFRTTP